MRQVNGLWIALMLCWFASGCAGQDTAPLAVTQRLESCPAPRPLPPVPFAHGEHIGSRANVEALLENTRRLRLEIDGLRGTLRCYEAQAPKDQP